MNKSIILNVLSLLILLFGIISIIISIINPMLLIKLNKQSYPIKNKYKFIKSIQKLYIFFGIACIIMPILTLSKIIEWRLLGTTIAVISMITSILTKRYADQK